LNSRPKSYVTIDSGGCARVWQLVWPWARDGNTQALAMLATGAFSAGLLPPGTSQDALARLRHTLIFAAHAATSTDAANGELLRGLLQEPLIADAGGRQLRECLAGQTAKEQCVKNAVKEGLLPSLASYTKELASAEKQSHAKAICILPGNAAPLPKQ
jgi:hypothetical protein